MRFFPKDKKSYSKENVKILVKDVRKPFSRGLVTVPIALMCLPVTAAIDSVRLIRHRRAQKKSNIPPAIHSEISELVDLFLKYSLLIKIVKVQNWPQFLAQLSNYEFRPPLRAKKDDPWYLTPSGEIIPYPAKKTAAGDHTATKKTSTTWIGPSYNKPFGSIWKNRPLVGVMFDRRRVNIKRMYTRDIGTIAKPWQDSIDQLRRHFAEIDGVEYSDLNAFFAAIQQSNETNEVLAELTRDAVIGIVVGRNDQASLELAKYYAQTLSRQLDRALNVYWYDSQGAGLSLIEFPSTAHSPTP